VKETREMKQVESEIARIHLLRNEQKNIVCMYVLTVG